MVFKNKFFSNSRNETHLVKTSFFSPAEISMNRFYLCKQAIWHPKMIMFIHKFCIFKRIFSFQREIYLDIPMHLTDDWQCQQQLFNSISIRWILKCNTSLNYHHCNCVPTQTLTTTELVVVFGNVINKQTNEGTNERMNIEYNL